MDEKTLDDIISIPITIIIIGVLMIFVGGTVIFSVMLNPPLNKRDIIKDFNKNKELYYIVKDYLVESEYEAILINENDGTMYTGLETGDILIDESVLPIFKRLFTNPRTVISKESNCIVIKRKSTKDKGIGVVYSIDGHTPDEESIEYLTLLEPLPEEGWYYYEDDYNKWRSNNS